jgi:hypothetical protein
MVHSAMHATVIEAAAKLSDLELLRRVAALAGDERHATVELIAHLAELDRRKLYRGQGYGSLFTYCTEALRLSEHATFNRIEAARAIRSFPVILDRLREGALNLSTVRLLAPHLTPKNHERLLAEASGRSKREVEVIVARLSPRPDVSASIRRLPTPAPTPAEATPSSGTVYSPLPQPEATTPSGACALRDGARIPAAPSTPARRPLVTPLTPERYRVQFTVGRETQEKLRRVQDLLRREIPDGDPGMIFDRALTLLLDEVARKKLAATRKPRPTRPADPWSRHVPAEVKRKVWIRDHGQCAFVSPGGRRCRARTFLEFHHVEAFGLGGPTTADNLSLRCHEHNAYEAELLFGTRNRFEREGSASHAVWSGGSTAGHNDMGPTRPGAT